MRYGILPGLALLLCACQTVRTVYDEYGNEVKETQGGGGEKDLSTHMEERFNASFSEKKNAQGVPQAVSNRVSAFQKDLKDASLNKEYFTKNYDGSGANEMSSMSFSGSDKRFSGAKEAYSGAMRDRIEKELHPAFASGSKGIYATDDAFAGSTLAMRASLPQAPWTASLMAPKRATTPAIWRAATSKPAGSPCPTRV